MIPGIGEELSKHVFGKNPDAVMWSERNFNIELEDVINQVERVKFSIFKVNMPWIINLA